MKHRKFEQDATNSLLLTLAIPKEMPRP